MLLLRPRWTRARTKQPRVDDAKPAIALFSTHLRERALRFRSAVGKRVWIHARLRLDAVTKR